MRPFVALVLAALPLVAGCASPLAPAATAPTAPAAPVPLVDPLAAGPLGVEWADYDAGAVDVGGPDANHSGYEYEARLRGRVWFPADAGPHPLLLFLHGQHATCGFMGDEALLFTVDDCSDDEGMNTAYPNHLGYAYLAERLASHGYVVASLLGYEVNARNGPDDVGMWARGELLLATLDAFRAGAEGIPPEAASRADLTRVGLMGHSRGGEGVVTAAHVNLARPEAERHALRGIVALAPTDFNGRGVPGVALLALVPYCDGDVSTLHGLRTFDHSRFLDDATDKVQVLVRGTNHNFYNERWYDDVGLPVWPGDDIVFSPLVPSCLAGRAHGGWRWTPEETQQEALAHVGGFLRWQVGGEVGLAPFLTGALPLPDAACPLARACPDAVVVTAALAGKRALLVVEEGEVPAAATLSGFDEARPCAGTGCHPAMRSGAEALRLAWSGPATLRLVPNATDWRAHDALLLRVAVPGWEKDPTARPVDLRVEVVDGTGATYAARAFEHSTALQRPPDPNGAGDAYVAGAKLALQAVRVPLADAGVDLSDVREVVVSFEGEGALFLSDVLVQPEPDVAA